MRFLRLTFLLLSFAPSIILARSLFGPKYHGYDQVAYFILSLVASVVLTLIGLCWYMLAADRAKPTRAVAAAAWSASLPLLLVAALFAARLARDFLCGGR